MELLPDRSYMIDSGTCVICNGSPEDGHAVVDTKYNLDTGFNWLDGRKYVCFVCASAIAKLIGFISAEASETATAAAAQAVAEAEALKARAAAIFAEFNAPVVVPEEDFETAMTRFGASQPEAKPPAKPKAQRARKA